MLNQKINFRIQSPLSPNHFLSSKIKDDKMKFLCLKFDLIDLNFSKILTVIQCIYFNSYLYRLILDIFF